MLLSASAASCMCWNTEMVCRQSMFFASWCCWIIFYTTYVLGLKNMAVIRAASDWAGISG